MKLSIPSLTAVLALSASVPATAQQPGAPRAPVHSSRVPLTIALVDQIPQTDQAFVLKRRPDLAPHDVILLRSNATPEDLADAIRAVLTVREIGGDTARVAATLRLRPHQTHPGPHRVIPWVPRVFADLHRAEIQDVAGVGHVRAVQIWLPPRNLAGRIPPRIGAR